MASWKELIRHPLSAEYEDIEGPAWDRFIRDLKQYGVMMERKVTLHEGKVLDGWQLLRGCIQLNIEPDFQTIPEHADPLAFVKVANDNRRHESAERIAKRIADRRERVGEARMNGESIRTIAEKEGVSKSTIEQDIEKTGVTVQGGTVTGKDDRQQPATKPEPPMCQRCARCKRVGDPIPKNCEMCRELRPKPAKKDPKPETPGAAPVDAFGTELPKRCRGAYADPWIQSAIDTIAIVEQKLREARLADGMAKRAKHYPFMIPKDFADGVGFAMNYLDDLLNHLKKFRPAGVCPSCSGEGCPECRQSGLVPREIYHELKKRK